MKKNSAHYMSEEQYVSSLYRERRYNDGRYVRKAAIGYFFLILMVVGFIAIEFIGAFSLTDTHYRALPPSFNFISVVNFAIIFVASIILIVFLFHRMCGGD